jgi:hypothetical protein
MKIEQRVCSKTLAFKLHTPVNHPGENIKHSEKDASLKSRTVTLNFSFQNVAWRTSNIFAEIIW